MTVIDASYNLLYLEWVTFQVGKNFFEISFNPSSTDPLSNRVIIKKNEHIAKGPYEICSTKPCAFELKKLFNIYWYRANVRKERYLLLLKRILMYSEAIINTKIASIRTKKELRINYHKDWISKLDLNYISVPYRNFVVSSYYMAMSPNK